MASRALIIEARFYDDIADMLQAGAKAELAKRRFESDVISVPGVLEIAPALSMALTSARRRDLPYALFVVLGCVIRGETYHFEIVSNEGNRAVVDLQVTNRLALGNGILTVETYEQALVRADPKQKDKGGDAAAAAIALYDLREALNR
ncbi:6,7-dimethyl-8-ribityllumazine synthase [Acuticoccus sp. I52.16.1]|uniref:6,7-dimethyl-8-ribityllumazine synthase n=1 Tax=Acuticoccus sp. I52.16.1 TaxID=2928472 RepID=UPI001FD0E4E7|nr:6,7-dimethyl-8-ribityllumazine synthase [Acuticoccus sp. I52.16.1]UOM33793.1 6,7-dimethyl-8-ribityllumazine synthase [Acuticoccus sp. I52.16.1]